MVSPADGSTLSGASETFSWTANGTTVVKYYLYFGSSPGAKDLGESGGLTASQTSYPKTGLPVDGSTVYVRLAWKVSTEWKNRDYSYTAASGSDPGTVATPTFTPDGGSHGALVNVTIATSTSGATIRYTTDDSPPTSTSGTVYSGPVPISSTTTLKATAYKSGLDDSAVKSATYTFSQAPAMVSPADGSTLSGASETFSWTANGTTVVKYYLYFGSSPGAKDLGESGGLTASQTSYPKTGLPVDGSTVYVRLAWKLATGWANRDYSYTAAGAGTPIVVGLGAGSDGWIEVFQDVGSDGTYDNTDSIRIEHPSGQQYLDETGESRPVLCDLDGDGRDELVIGFGPFPSDGGWIEIKDDVEADYAHLVWLNVDFPTYNSANGETFPACGDLDGDGKDEIVVGLGAGGEGWVKVFDDAGANFVGMPDTLFGDGWIQIPWTFYINGRGELHPAIGNLDDDVAEELVLGVGEGGFGMVQVLDDAATGFAPFFNTPGLDGTVQLGWDGYNRTNGTIWPAVCDLDGDGSGELVLGLGRGGGGLMQVLEASDGFAPRVDTPLADGFVALTWEAYNSAVGATYPVCGDVDDDGLEELVIGLARYEANGWFEILDDLEQGLSYVSRSPVYWSGADQAGGLTRPTVGSAVIYHTAP